MDETTVDAVGAVDASVAPLQPGDPRRLGSYELIGRLGVGGQGAVFLGTSASGDRVAVKLLHPDLTEDTDARGRFVREAMAAKQVARFCAAQVLDVQVAGDRPYIVSEYVPGPSLYRLVKDGGPLSGGQLERLAIGIATALVAIHQAGIVHRDLKPANVLIGPDGPRVIDFGIAKALAATATATSRVLGTPAYMAPEQIRGGQVDGAVDVFAWGALMAFVATGRPPFGTDSIPLVVQRIVADEPDLTGMDEPLKSLVRDCLAKDPAARPTAQQILLRLLGQGRMAGSMPMPMPIPMPMAGTAAGSAAGSAAGVAGTAAAGEAITQGVTAPGVLAQAATIAGGRPYGEAPTLRAVPGIPEVSGPLGSAGPGSAVPASAAPVSADRVSADRVPADRVSDHRVPSARVSAVPVAKRPALSRAFIAAGLAAVLVAIVTLLLMTIRPGGNAGNDNPSGGATGTTPAGQGGSAGPGTYQGGLPQGTGRPEYGNDATSGGATRQIGSGGGARQNSGHGSTGGSGGHGSGGYGSTDASATWTPTPTVTPTATPTTTPTATPTGTPTTTDGGSDHTTDATQGNDTYSP